jgi:hypothetical protein
MDGDGKLMSDELDPKYEKYYKDMDLDQQWEWYYMWRDIRAMSSKERERYYKECDNEKR